MKLNKLIKDFFNISLSATKANSVHSNEEVKSYLIAMALNNDSLESATGISADTIQRRLALGQGQEMPWLSYGNRAMLDILPHLIRRNGRVRWSVIIDESKEPFFGSYEDLKDDIGRSCLPDFLTSYRIQRGSTGSFHYTVIALHSKLGTFPLCVLPKLCGADHITAYERVLREVKRVMPGVCLLADRGYGSAEMIGLCQRLRLDYCIRLKKTGRLKSVKKRGRRFFWHSFGDVRFRVVMHKSHGRETFFFAVGKKAGASQWFRLLYKDRWSIENLFKNADSIQLRTNSRNPLFRLFCFMLSMFLVLLYQLRKISSKRIFSIRRTLYDLFSIKVLVVLRVT
ncbi:MAG: transposase [archaeon]